MSDQNINGYQNEQTSLNDNDYFDIDAFLGVDNYESRKVKWVTIKNSLMNGVSNIYNSDGTLTGNRVVTQNNNSLSFTGGDFSVDGTTFNVDDSANAVGVGVSTPAASAVLEVASTTKGFLFPRMTETQRGNIGSPATGLMVYQTDGDEGVYIYKSFGWVQVI